MEGIAKPVRSVNNRLYEVAGAGGKTYIPSLQEKAPGKIVDINDPKEFNEELFFQLGMLMGRMHKLTMCYRRKPTLPLNSNGMARISGAGILRYRTKLCVREKRDSWKNWNSFLSKRKIMGLSILISTPTIFLSKIKE